MVGNEQVSGPGVTVAEQDTSHPVYIDTSVMQVRTGTFSEARGQFDRTAHVKCDAANEFFLDSSAVPRTDVIFFCSPNNPTSAAAMRVQLAQLSEFPKKNGSIIFFDTAYAPFIHSLSRSLDEYF